MKKLVLLAPACLFVFGCQTVPYQGTARDVVLKPKKEGTIAIPVDPREEDRTKANMKMAANCEPLKVNVLEEGEAVVGQKVNSTASNTNRASSETKVGSLFGIPLMSGDKGGVDQSASSVTTEVKEWRIKYECKKTL